VVFADIDVELDRVDAENGRGVILEVDRARLGFSHPLILGARSPAQLPRNPMIEKEKLYGNRVG
jgi:hypothetical protein